MKKYCCGVVYQWELGETNTDGYFYESVEQLKENTKCWVECGILELEFDGPEDPKTKNDVKSYVWVEEQKGWEK